jgi:hypothetical protein
MAKRFTVVANLPASIELTKRTSQNALTVDIKIGEAKEGTLVIAQGSVEWWPGGNKVNAHRMNWGKFKEIMESQVPPKRSRK